LNVDSLKGSRVLVTGGSGFLGQHLTRRLMELGAGVTWPCRDQSNERGVVDLTCPESTVACVANTQPDYVFHLAGYNGGISLNLSEPGRIFHDNTLMALNVLEACRLVGVKKVVGVVASCAYPEWQFAGDHLRGWARLPNEVLAERGFLDGRPHPSVAGHAYAKRNLLLACSFYRTQYGLEAVCACPTTLYGPGDSYDPDRTKVFGGMVKRFVDAVDDGASEVTVWGNGKPHREFLYAPDCARLLVDTLLKYDDSFRPLNLGTGQELSVAELARTVAAGVQFSGEIRFDYSKTNGQFRKRLDLTHMKYVLGEFEPTPLADGLAATIADYRARKTIGEFR
jgi:GDP-L-fucose synthase